MSSVPYNRREPKTLSKEGLPPCLGPSSGNGLEAPQDRPEVLGSRQGGPTGCYSHPPTPTQLQQRLASRPILTILG